MAFYEKNLRSLGKTVTYRTLIFISNFFITLLVTGKIDLAAEVAFLTLLINAMIYYFHERFWNKIRWGKVNLPRHSERRMF